MALTPIDEVHALQIQAGALGRKAGHEFEDSICYEINNLKFPFFRRDISDKHVFIGDPARLILEYIILHYREEGLNSVLALSTGALATSEDGRKWLQINGANVRRCKSDIVLKLEFLSGQSLTVGVSTKQCNNPNPTNAQLYFTTARGFSKLLRDNGIPVSEEAVTALRQFCGDVGFRPLDNPVASAERKVDPRRYFWEELPDQCRLEWETTLRERQDDITRLLLQKAYFEDPFVPDFILHKTKRAESWGNTEVAIFSIEELVRLSRAYQSFTTRPYSVRKGSYRDPEGITHQAPRFGIVQMQRGGQAQHPDQLQFNLEASYFYRLDNL
jgi:hypothetical protein